MTAKDIRYGVHEYFRYKRQCPLVSFERGVRYDSDRPDIQVMDKDRNLIEVEIKVSMSDFKADGKKRKWRHWELHPRRAPFQFYFAVSFTLGTRIMQEDLLPPRTGLLVVATSGSDPVWVQKNAPINREACILTVKEIQVMIRHQTGTLLSIMKENRKLRK